MERPERDDASTAFSLMCGFALAIIIGTLALLGPVERPPERCGQQQEQGK